MLARVGGKQKLFRMNEGIKVLENLVIVKNINLIPKD